MNTPASVLYKRLSTPEGLALWFAEDVASEDGKTFAFLWHKEVSRALLVDSQVNEFVRFRWEDDEDDEYFEFRVEKAELTKTIVLRVIDFSEEEEFDEVVQLWNFQIEGLKKILAA